ncbi:acyl-CoA carboxylase epsilon subunit [Streptacidiphilus cavernicola]|uniref:Acyl-CoA carboxylase epsilon subunit n=1 Tax=Streptacidiphilus cavernicola TaxID=3342716 RepID=A0ABV6VTH5_9ACTN
MPPIKVLHGRPSPEELAAVLAVVSARAAANAARVADDAPAAAWSSRARALRIRRPGPTAWRTSAWAR